MLKVGDPLSSMDWFKPDTPITTDGNCTAGFSSAPIRAMQGACRLDDSDCAGLSDACCMVPAMLQALQAPKTAVLQHSEGALRST